MTGSFLAWPQILDKEKARIRRSSQTSQGSEEEEVEDEDEDEDVDEEEHEDEDDVDGDGDEDKNHMTVLTTPRGKKNMLSTPWSVYASSTPPCCATMQMHLHVKCLSGITLLRECICVQNILHQ